MPQETTALALTGGGARAAYQVGCLRAIARARPGFAPGILTGVSAGAINAAHLASREDPFPAAVERLCRLWRALDTRHVFRVDVRSIAGHIVGWGARLLSGGHGPPMRGMVDTAPLRTFLSGHLPHEGGRLHGIRRAIDAGVLRAFAITTTSYASGRSITWVEGDRVELWQRPQRAAVATELGIDHVMASAALPIFFPAVRIGNEWHGDGGIRQMAPLSPAMHLGAERILAVSPRYRREDDGANRELELAYPSPARVAGVLLNAIFLDALDFDAMQMQRINQLLARRPAAGQDALRPVSVLVLRPTRDIGRLAAQYEARLPRVFRFFERGLGSHETRSADTLALVNFDAQYIQQLMQLGEEDTERRMAEIGAFLGSDG
jgi:NTE family protein